MTVIAACHTADGTIVFGADRQVTAADEIRDGTKLSFYPFLEGQILIGMAASDVNGGFNLKFDLFRALRHVGCDQNPVEVIQERMTRTSENSRNNAQILCAVASSALASPKLLGISDMKVEIFDGRKFCCIGSGDGAAHAFLEQIGPRLHSLRDVQIAVCASVWLAKQSDPLCGGGTDIWWLNSSQDTEKLKSERIRSWEDYFKTSPPNPLPRWMEGVP